MSTVLTEPKKLVLVRSWYFKSGRCYLRKGSKFDYMGIWMYANDSVTDTYFFRCRESRIARKLLLAVTWYSCGLALIFKGSIDGYFFFCFLRFNVPLTVLLSSLLPSYCFPLTIIFCFSFLFFSYRAMTNATQYYG